MGTISVVLTGDEARLIRALDRTQAKMREVSEAGKQAGESSAQSFTKVENAFGRAFGAGAIGTLGPWALAIKGIELGLNAVTKAYEEIEKAAENAAKNTIDRGNAVGSLAKYAANKDVFANLSTAQRQIARDSGFSNQESAKIVAEMAEVGYTGGNEDAVQRSWRLKKLGFEHAGKASMDLYHLGGGKLGRAKSLAALTRPGDTEELVESTADIHALAASIGVSDDELMASIASAGKAAGSTKEGASQVKELLGGLQKHGFKGTLEQAVQKFGKVKANEQLEKHVTGGRSGLAALRALGQESGQHLLGRMGRSMSDEEALSVADGDEDVRAGRLKAEAEGKLRDVQEEAGRVKARADAERARLHAEDLEDNGGEEGAWTWAKNWNREGTPDWRMDPGPAKPRESNSGDKLDKAVDKLVEHAEETAINTRPKSQTYGFRDTSQ